MKQTMDEGWAASAVRQKDFGGKGKMPILYGCCTGIGNCMDARFDVLMCP